MKKSITFLLILLCSGLINGQLPFMPKLSSPETEVQHFTTAEYDQLANLKSTRSIIWSEDFGGGAIPADWYIWETTSLAYNFIWSNSPVPGPNGQFVASTLPFMSSSVGNGYLCMPSDEYNTPNSPSYIDIDAYAMLPVMNFDTIASAMIVFEQYFRYCCS